MPYQKEEIIKSQEIFYYLLEHHELAQEDEEQLYRAYMESEAVQELLRFQSDTADCAIQRYGNVIYLIPGKENCYLGYSKSQLKKELCRSNGTDNDYYLVQFSILVLLLEFYDGSSTTSKVREYIRLGDYQNSISEHLDEGLARYSEEEQEEKGIAFTRMKQAYEALRSDVNTKRSRSTKEGFVYGILRFLERQGLIQYIEQDGMIFTTAKLDHFMDWYLLNNRNYERIKEILGGDDDEQD